MGFVISPYKYMLWALIRSALLMSTITFVFFGDLEKIIPELSSNNPPLQVLC